ncbi:phenylacetaldoxime dehydratase family protein [Pseudomonas chlororaphis]|uniref:phenylacetaldoxime dehydratase family protein n=1 Tax=Pseudomonas chlororaphis TaxID=587753 RepID=UPI00056CCEA3|nr:phenylacetaldoxime dehydratase family protein [Pseudomonas chlororaphis]
MESAIPQHLRQARKFPVATPAAFQPPFPAWSSRFAPLTGQVVMAYFGVQSLQKLALNDLSPVTDVFAQADGPLFWDGAECVDAQGFHNCMAIAYWADVSAFDRWQTSSGFAGWWQDKSREQGPLGWFMEVVCPTADRFETVFSSPDCPEGIGHLASHISDPILEHGYWGSTRDRLPVAQVDGLAPGGVATGAGSGSGSARQRVPGRDNLCLIRSGQDWSDTRDQERGLYLDDMQPVLEAGMTFLRDEGLEIGCLSCRFMQVLDSNGLPIEKTFGLALFDDLANLERWAKTHPTHVAIFGGFMNYVQTLNFQTQLRLYHEVSVIPASAQFFEYVNCHPGSGLLSR